MLKKLVLYSLCIMVLFTLAACSVTEDFSQNADQQQEQATEQNQVIEKIRMASWSQPIVEQSNLFLAEKKGWFEEAGLEFEYIPGAGGGDAVKNIIAGNAEIAFANVEAVLLAAEQGADLKIIYTIYPENVFNLVSLKESKITSVEDLRGQHVGVYSLSSGTYDNLRVLLYSAGMTEADVHIIATGVLNFAPLMNQQVLATAATDTGLYDAREQGLGEVDVLEIRDVLNTPSDVFVVTEETYRNKKDSLIRFLQVYRDSVQYTMENPEEAAQAAQGMAIDAQDLERDVDIVKIRNRTSVNDMMKEKGLGWNDADILKKVEQTYIEIGLLERPVGVENMISNELVEELE